MFKSGRNLFSGHGYTFKTAAALLILFSVVFAAAVQSFALEHGDKIVNNARLNSAGSAAPATTSVTVTAVVRTPSTIEILTHAPLLPGAQNVNVATTAYRSGSPSGPYADLPAPLPVGAATPVDLSQPAPLIPATQIHQGDPIFIRLTDLDQNMDSDIAETVFVTIANPGNGDMEIIKLTETGPDTGVFTGYLPTSGGPLTLYNGSISVKDGDTLHFNYVDIADGSDASIASVLVDPFGIFIDSSTGLPVNGATITLINTATGLPATVLGDDGISAYPATVPSGGTVTDGSGKVYAFPQGGYRFPFVYPGSYRFQITPPSGYGYPSTVPTATIQSLPGAPFTVVPGSRGENFVINPGPAIRLDIPLDPASSSLWLQKTANKQLAGHGDFIAYRLTVTNNSTLVSAGGVQIADAMPVGFRYRDGSARLNGVSTSDPVISANGRTLTFTVGTLLAGASAHIDYVAEVTAGTRLGDAVNSAVANTNTGGTSNTAQVTVKIRDDFMRTKSTIVGRVTTGECHEETGEGGTGLEGVRIYLEDGTFVISDKRGMFHFEGVSAGLHVVQLDSDSLPEGYEPYACTQNSRFAGRAFSQFVETQGGALWRADFYVRGSGAKRAETAAPKDAAPKPEEKDAPDTPSKDAPADPAEKTPEKTITEPEGIIAPLDQDILVNKIQTVRVCLASQLAPRLLVDGREVPKDRIGFTMKDKNTGKSIYSYIGVDFGDAGQHTVEIQGLDPFGNARLKKTHSVTRSGEITSIRVKSEDGNVADGKTPVKIVVELFDANGVAIPAAAELEIREGTLVPLKKPDLFALPPKAGSHTVVPMNKAGEIFFQPVANSGLYRAVLGYNRVTVEVETYVQPKLRDWILVGLAEGTLGYSTASGNMENLSGADNEEDFYQDDRIAFFAKGRIKGKWLLTMSYDSAKNSDQMIGNGLFQSINPETYYTLYGDTSQQQYDAASAKRLYVKIEREQFYAMFGDYDTGLTVTELSRYSRRVTGLKTEMHGKNFEFNAFASKNEQLFKRDEIPGNGTSGIYRFSRNNILPNTEKITIEIRDRFRSEVLISSRTLNRFTDYTIDYDAGTLIFREPIFSRDENFNPVMIVAEYETLSSGGDDYSYGGRAGVKLLNNKLKAGGTYIHEGQGDGSSDLYGVDATIQIDDQTKIHAEYATSDYSAGSTQHSGNAYLAEVSRTTGQYNAKAYYREQDAGFGMGQQPGSEADTRKIGAEGSYRFNEKINAAANLYRHYNLMTNATRDLAEGKIGYAEKNYGASLGFLHAYDRLGDGSKKESSQVTMGGRILTLYERLTLSMNHAQSIGSNDNSDFPTRTILGAEFAVTGNLALMAAHEFTWGSGAETQNTRVGLRSSPWSGAELHSSVERQFNEDDERVFANVGMKQSWQVNKDWKVDAGVDRSYTISKSENYSFNTNVQPVSGNRDDFTAVTGGATYQVKNLTWDNRLEFRFADTEDKWGLMSGVVKEVDDSWAWSARLQCFHTDAAAGLDTTTLELRHGIVYRPPETTLIVLNRFDLIIDEQSGSAGMNYDSWRLINNLHANYRPRENTQISLHYGAKYVQEKIEGTRYIGYTDLWGAEGRYDLNKHWDVGLHGSVLHSWNTSVFDYSGGMSVGYNIVKNVWISLGYNVTGFEDKDFSQANFTAKGPFVKFRFKFDQESVREAVRWLSGN